MTTPTLDSNRGVLHKEHCPTLRAERSGLKVIEVTKCILYGMLTNGVYAKMHDCSRRVYDPSGVSPTIHTVGGGNLEPKVIIKQATSQGYTECEIGGVADLSYPESKNKKRKSARRWEDMPDYHSREQWIMSY